MDGCLTKIILAVHSFFYQAVVSNLLTQNNAALLGSLEDVINQLQTPNSLIRAFRQDKSEWKFYMMLKF